MQGESFGEPMDAGYRRIRTYTGAGLPGVQVNKGKTRIRIKTLIAAVASVLLIMLSAGCGSSTEHDGRNPDGSVSITMAGWALDTRPEFRALAAAFHQSHPNITLTVKEYSADDYDTQLIADLSAGKAPDVFPIKNLKMYYAYASPGALADLSDEMGSLKGDTNIPSLEDYILNGKSYALPYRQDAWLLYYNATMLRSLGIEIPDGSWTWDSYMAICREIKDSLRDKGENGVYPTYHHTSMQSLPQAIALAQSSLDSSSTGTTGDGVRSGALQETKERNQAERRLFFSGDYTYLKAMYSLFLTMQDEQLTLGYNTISSSNTTYQSQFGMQKAVLLLMGSWFMGPLAQQQAHGDAEAFDWGVTSLPQVSEGTTEHPITFGDPTGFAVSADAPEAKKEAAKAFVKWAAGPKGAMVTASTGSVPAYMSDAALDTFFANKGLPQDEESRTVIQRSVIQQENPVGEATQVIQDELSIAQSSILSETKSAGEAITKAEHAIANTGLLP